MSIIRSSTLLMVGLSLLVGCSTKNLWTDGGAAARNLARVSLGQTAAYESAVNAKIDAERKLYEDSVASMRKLEPEVKMSSERVALKSLALRYDGIFVDQAHVTADNVRSFASDAIDAAKAVRQASDHRKDLLKNQMFLNLSELSVQTGELTKTKQGLERMQAEPSDAARLTAWFNFLKDTKTEFDKESKAAKTQPTTKPTK